MKNRIPEKWKQERDELRKVWAKEKSKKDFYEWLTDRADKKIIKKKSKPPKFMNEVIRQKSLMDEAYRKTIS